MTRNATKELDQLLSDMYSVELQAIAQLKTAPKLAGHPTLADDFTQHYAETELQAELVRSLLEKRDIAPSKIKEAVMKLGGKGFLLFAKVQPETPGRLVAHAYSYEAMEWAGYQLAIRVAEAAGAPDVVEGARKIAAQERAMMDRLESHFDLAEEASHANLKPEDMPKDLRKHLAEAHAIEAQSIKLLEKAERTIENQALNAIFHQHLAESHEQAQQLEDRLHELGGDISKPKDAAMTMGAINWSMFFQAQKDTPAKLTAFAYAFEHLEIAGYELLRRTARRIDDQHTARLCESILMQERSMTDRLHAAFDDAVGLALGRPVHG